ncbi:MAG: hypothetical protein M5U25_11365 [Planctomycetota bacterium]|nr:hypothetical protein [Planctomycetota bacterium]
MNATTSLADLPCFSQPLFISAAYVTIGRRFGHSGIAVSPSVILAVAIHGRQADHSASPCSFGTLAELMLLLFDRSPRYTKKTSLALGCKRRQPLS